MKINKILLSAFALGVFSLATLVGCEDDNYTENQVHANYVSLMDLSAPVEILQGESTTIQGKIYASEVVGNDRTFQIEIVTDYPDLSSGDPDPRNTTINTSDFTVPASVTLPAGSKEVTFPISITNTDLGYTGKALSIRIKQEPGFEVAMSSEGSVAAGNFKTYSRPVVINARTACDQNLITIDISTDNYGSETTWELYDANLNQIATGGPYSDGQIGGGESRSLCLPDGNYTFYIIDSYGDGMNSGAGVGSYTLSKRDANGAQVQIATGGTFGSFEEVAFSLP